MLLTSEPIGTFDEALKIIHIYIARWRVEYFHKAWKGAGIERQRMETTGLDTLKFEKNKPLKV